MPWYAIVYLCLIWLLTVLGIYDDCRGKKPVWFAAANLASAAVITFFVWGYYSSTVAHYVGIWAIPVIILGLLWEVYSYTLDMKEIEAEPNAEDNKALVNIAKFSLIAFILVGYLAGISIVYHLLTGTVIEGIP